MYCGSCGQLLDLATVSTRLSELASGFPRLTDDLKRLLGLTVDPEYFGPTSRIVLMAAKQITPLEFDISSEQGVIIGRLSANLDSKPFIDLSACGAYDMGVSRNHAELSRNRSTLRIADLNSANGTYVNGLQVQPGELRLLTNGDRIQLANLKLRILFRHLE
jgi:hypothetical protein